MMAARGWAAAWRDTLAELLRDKGALLLIVLAPVFYGFFYPWPYATEVLQRVPVAIVDLDHSSLSRQIVRYADASPDLRVAMVTGDEETARQAMWRGEIEGYALLTRDLKRNVLRDRPAPVVVSTNGSYALYNKAVMTGFTAVVGTVSAGIEIAQRTARGQGRAQAMAGRSPVGVSAVALYNPTGGYGSYVVPAVALIIMQQTLLMGVAMLAGTWAEAGRLRASASVWLGRVLAFSTAGLFAGLVYFGWIFWLQDYPRGGNPLGALVLLLCYAPAISVAGALLGAWLKDREQALQAWLFTSLPIAFLSGFAWPVESLPPVLQAARWIFPSTAGIDASLRLNQMGAPLADVAGSLSWLAAWALAGFAALAWWMRPREPGTLRGDVRSA